jgi:hypothetical protein
MGYYRRGYWSINIQEPLVLRELHTQNVVHFYFYVYVRYMEINNVKMQDKIMYIEFYIRDSVVPCILTLY